MSKSLKLLFFLILFSLLNLKAEEKIKLILKSIPSSYKGNCPKEFIFKGTIVAKEPMVVKYKFLRSDGATSPIETIDFKYPKEAEIVDK